MTFSSTRSVANEVVKHKKKPIEIVRHTNKGK
jgi:hypothetical protein